MVATGALEVSSTPSPGAPDWLSPSPAGTVVRVFLVAEVRLYREGLERYLGKRRTISVVGSSGSGADALARIGQIRPDVALLGLGAPDGLTVAGEIRSSHPQIKVIALGIQDVESDVIPWAEVGMAGYVSRDASLADLVATIERASRGEMLLSPRVAADLVARISRMAAAGSAAPPGASLTTREVDIVRLIQRGYSNKEIARALSIAVPTVKNHVHNILDKLRVRRRSDAVSYLARAPLLARMDPED